MGVLPHPMGQNAHDGGARRPSVGLLPLYYIVSLGQNAHRGQNAHGCGRFAPMTNLLWAFCPKLGTQNQSHVHLYWISIPKICYRFHLS